MTAFGLNIVYERGLMPTIKIQEQVYHRNGSILLLEYEDHQLLQVYFINSMQK